MMAEQQSRLRLATAWLGGCSGCHMSFLDLAERLIPLLQQTELVYGPLVDSKTYPADIDICLVEGAVNNHANLELACTIRQNSKQVVSFGDCAVTGNVTSMRNRIPVNDLLTKIYHEIGAPSATGTESDGLPALLPKVLPLHQVIKVDAYLPGCPPAPERIVLLLNALLNAQPLALPPEMLRFG